jgi:hypothetical protein
MVAAVEEPPLLPPDGLDGDDPQPCAVTTISMTISVNTCL